MRRFPVVCSAAVLFGVTALAETPASARDESSATSSRFAVTLTAWVDTSLEYVQYGFRADGCTYTRFGRSSRRADLVSGRTIIRARGGRRGYAPSHVVSVRQRQRDVPGDVVTLINCPDGGSESEATECETTAAPATASLPTLAFARVARGKIAWEAVPQQPMTPCGLDGTQIAPASLEIATGRIDERALLSRRRKIVRARGQREVTDKVTVAGQTVRRTRSVRWTLTFRRLM
jgi:hypothetical protein